MSAAGRPGDAVTADQSLSDRVRRRIRWSTVILAVAFAVTLVTYLLVRPPESIAGYTPTPSRSTPGPSSSTTSPRPSLSPVAPSPRPSASTAKPTRTPTHAPSPTQDSASTSGASNTG